MNDPNFKYPFLFVVRKGNGPAEHIVIIANCFDLTCANTGWMNDKDLPPECTYMPEIDLSESKHLFGSGPEGELAAKQFIKKWWAELNI